MTSSKVEILRSLLFEDGAAMSVFLSEGGRLSGVVLEPSGTSFTYVQEVRMFVICKVKQSFSLGTAW